MTNVRVRFAPSPTGKPHLGSIRQAMFDWLMARHSGGKFILRIEDTDRKRFDPDAVAEMMRALRWVGLDWDEGPEAGGDFGPYFQSERLEIYDKYARELIAGGHAYKCWCTPERLDALRKSQEERGLPTGYDRRCRYLPEEEKRKYEEEGAPYTIRFATPREGTITWDDVVFGEMSWEARVVDDYILIKSDGYPTYHMAATIDDHLMQITHVIRGEEWLSTAPLHLMIYQALGWEPPKFVHTTHILGPGRKKLSKRDASAEFLNYEREGYLPEAMFNAIATIGWSAGDDKEIYTREELVRDFSLEGLVGHSAILDPEKVLWFNGIYIRNLAPAELAERCLPFLQEARLVGPNPSEKEKAYIADVIKLEQERMKTLAEAPELADFFLLPDDKYPFDENTKQKWFTVPGMAQRLAWVRDHLAKLVNFDHDSIEQVVRAASEHFGVKGGDVIHPVRLAVSGRPKGPGLFEMMAVLGPERVQRRLERAIGMIESLAG
ncbi:MAG TPA: glutamate--tRNA ligase [Capsulimonadaceae bacterium]|nr:glutamate--tRNA ligase [Capsulimonadaceae bacterium]